MQFFNFSSSKFGVFIGVLVAVCHFETASALKVTPTYTGLRAVIKDGKWLFRKIERRLVLQMLKDTKYDDAVGMPDYAPTAHTSTYGATDAVDAGDIRQSKVGDIVKLTFKDFSARGKVAELLQIRKGLRAIKEKMFGAEVHEEEYGMVLGFIYDRGTKLLVIQKVQIDECVVRDGAITSKINFENEFFFQPADQKWGVEFCDAVARNGDGTPSFNPVAYMKKKEHKTIALPQKGFSIIGKDISLTDL